MRSTQPAAPAPMAVSTVGAYNPQAWSLLNDLRNVLSALQRALSSLLAPAPGSNPPAPAPQTPPVLKGKTQFTVSSFNILGSNHTDGRGGKGYASGATRIKWAAELLVAKSVEVVGFQEMANDQVQAFKQAAGDKYGIYPGTTLGKWGSQNSIAWRKDTWDLVKAEHMEIPFLNGMKRQVPYVRLKNKHTGQEVYFTNFHNAAHRKTGPDQQVWRNKATDLEIALVNRLKRETGLPVIVTGDMNERQNYFNRMTREADMTSANFGPVKSVPKRTGIDWIFGSKGVNFSGFHREKGAFQQKVSDHAMLVSEVTIGK